MPDRRGFVSGAISVRNGPEKSTIVATFIVEKDKPLVEPAPA